MNAKQWRAKGLKTIFRQGGIYLVRIEHKPSPVAVEAYIAPLNKGRWMEIPESMMDFAPLSALTRESARDITRTIAACYCDNGVDICDFCAGIRSAPDAFEGAFNGQRSLNGNAHHR